MPVIGDLPQDSTPSLEDGMIPYSEDGVHLSYMPLSDFVGIMSQNEDEDGTGSMAAYYFPDGSIGYTVGQYFSESILYGGSGYRLYDYFPCLTITEDTISNNGSEFASEYITFDPISKSNAWNYGEQGGSGNSGNISLLNIGEIKINLTPGHDQSEYQAPPNITWKTDNITCGFNVASGYNSKIRENYPFVLCSYKQSMLQWDACPVDENGDPLLDEFGGIDDIDCHIVEKKIPMVGMLSTNSYAGYTALNGKMEGPYWYDSVPEIHGQETEDYYYINRDVYPSQPYKETPGLLMKNRNAVNKDSFYKSSVPLVNFSHSCNFQNEYFKHECREGSDDVHTGNGYIVTQALIEQLDDEYYDDQRVDFRLQLYDTYYVHGIGAGDGTSYHKLCDHIIQDDGTEFWIFYQSKNTIADRDSIFPNGGTVLNQDLFTSGDDNIYVTLNNTLHKDPPDVLTTAVDRTMPRMKAGNHDIPGWHSDSSIRGDVYKVYGEANVYFHYSGSDYSPIMPDEWEDWKNAEADYFAFGTTLKPFASAIIGSDNSFGICVPTIRKALYSESLMENATLTGNKLIDTINGYYGAKEMCQYGYINFKIGPYGQYVGNCISLGNETLKSLIEEGAGSGTLPLPVSVGKVLTIRRNNDTVEWAEGSYPLTLHGNIDTDSYGYDNGRIKTPNRISLASPYLEMGRGIRARQEDENTNPKLYIDSADLDVGEYINIKGKQYGGTSKAGIILTNKTVNRSLIPDTSRYQVLTEFELDYGDIKNGLDIRGGSGITVSTSFDSSHNLRSYVLSAEGSVCSLFMNFDRPYRNHMHIEDSTWTTINAYKRQIGYSEYEYAPWPISFTPDKSYYIDLSVCFEVPENIAPGSYAKLALCYAPDSGEEYLVDSDAGEISNIQRTGNFEDVRLLIPGVKNTLRISGMISFYGNNINNNLYLNMYHNAGVPLGTNTLDPVEYPNEPVPNLAIKVATQQMRIWQSSDIPEPWNNEDEGEE